MANQSVVTEEQMPRQHNPAAGCRRDPISPASKLTDPQAIDTALEETLSGPSIEKILSKRERQILEYIVEGNTNKEIAQKLYRTQRTVEYHRNRLMRKLDTHTTAELVKRAILMGIC